MYYVTYTKVQRNLLYVAMRGTLSLYLGNERRQGVGEGWMEVR